MTTHAKAGDCAVCWGTDDGGFRGYCDIPAWLGFGGASAILRLCCLQYLPGDPAPLLEESLGDHLRTGAPLQCCVGGSAWDLLDPLVLIKDYWCVKEVRKHHYGPQHGNFH